IGRVFWAKWENPQLSLIGLRSMSMSPKKFQKAPPSVDSGGRPLSREKMGPMMSRQKELPSIPVAPLQETLDRYLKSLKLLLTTEQFEETQKFFIINACDTQGIPYNEHRIMSQLLHVVRMSQENGNRLGLLKASDRDIWANAYARLRQSPKNAESLEAINEAAFALCLDKKPSVDEESDEVIGVRQVLLGGTHGENGANRWFDKTVQLIVGENGHSGILFEPTPIDGGVRLALADHCCDYMIRNDAEVTILHFPSYGKDLIKSRHMSPDSFLQMAIQLAFH
ncbi:carnitine acyltransferase, putative, partial [Ixodes scapularis]